MVVIWIGGTVDWSGLGRSSGYRRLGGMMVSVWGAVAPVRGGRRRMSVLGLDRAAVIDGWEKDVAGLGGKQWV
ncbi:hypothetical protein M0R45_022977 [Rubus argutus]|uniref:Uncharacterized protein n=1 Tax=Rubus argutus TaxID=59490 RepID=A0AAW1WN80_RUBAR